MTTLRRAVHSAVGVLFGAIAIVPCAHSQSRGELLYSTHCIACHTSEMHWRDKKAATDWTSLKFEVRRWQRAASLGWGEADIQEVTRYLNESVYRYAEPSDRLASITPSTRDIRVGLFDAGPRGAGAFRTGASDALSVRRER